MSNDTIVGFRKPGEFEDGLTEMLRAGARRLIAEAVEAELSEFLAGVQEHKDSRGRRAVVRNGYLPEREIQTGLGAVSVKVPKVRDRTGSGMQFRSALLPPYLRRTRSLEELIPWLYLKGVSTGDFQEALTALLGPQARGGSRRELSAV